MLEESRTMAMALLSEHNYETATEHGFTFSQRPRIYEHSDTTVVVYDVDVLGTDPSHFEEDAEGLHPPMAPYLHSERVWPDGSYLRTLCVHGGKLVGGSTRGVLVVTCLATLLGKLKGLRRRSAHFFPGAAPGRRQRLRA